MSEAQRYPVLVCMEGTFVDLSADNKQNAMPPVPEMCAPYPAVPFIDNAVGRLRNWGYEPVIASHALPHSQERLDDRREWLRTHFAPRLGELTIITSTIAEAAETVGAIAVISDRPAGNLPSACTELLLLTSYNDKLTSDKLIGGGWLGNHIMPAIHKARRNYHRTTTGLMVSYGDYA